MNEYSRLEPQSIISQADEAIILHNEANSRLRAARRSKMAFIDDDTSSSRGIILLKQKMRDMVRIIDALILANLCDIRDYQILIALVSEVGGNINGRLTLWLLNEAINNINHYEGRLQRARMYLHLPVDDFPIQSGQLYTCAQSMIWHYENILRSLNETVKHLNGRIDLYNNIESQSRLLFIEGDELRTEAMRGFVMINQASSGLPNSFSYPGLSVWRGNLDAKKEDFSHLKDAKVEAAEEFISLLSESGIPFPDGWSEEDKLEFAKRYLAEMHLLQAFMIENFADTNYHEELAEHDREQIALIFLSEPELAFHLTFDQRVALLAVLEEHGMWYGPISDFLNTVLTEEELANTRLSSRFPGDSFALQAGQTYGAATLGTTHHDWYTTSRLISWFDAAASTGQAVQLASSWQPWQPSGQPAPRANLNPSVNSDIIPEVFIQPKPKQDPNRPYLNPNSRPSFRRGVVEQTFENAKGPDGLVRDPLHSDIVIEWKPGQPRIGVWDMGHLPGHKYSNMHKKYLRGELTPREFRDWYNNPKNYRPELPSTNRGHSIE